MPIKTSGSLSLNEIRTEFGPGAIPDPITFSNYYRGGSYVPDTSINNAIPTSGRIAVINFYGASAVTTTYFDSASAPGLQELVTTRLLGAGTWYIMTRMVGGGGGGGGSDGNAGSPGGAGTSLQLRFRVTVLPGATGRVIWRSGGGGALGGTGAGFGSGAGGGGLAPGGRGGDPGNRGSSGGGGGGGGSTTLQFQPDVNSPTTIVLAGAGGGGGGVGAGLRSITQTPGTVSMPGAGRGTTGTLSDFTGITAAPNFWAQRTNAYQISTTSNAGQGWNTMRNFYPPGLVDLYDTTYDSGSGGGGGGGNGWGGGLGGAADNSSRWIFNTITETDKDGAVISISTSWAQPNEFSGEHGSYGYVYYNLLYMTTFTGMNPSGNSFVSNLGAAGQAGVGFATNGGGGGHYTKITNNARDFTYY